jgi:hypothetical protein
MKGAELASIICEIITILDRIFWSKKDTLLGKRKVGFEGYEKMLIRNETILEKQSLKRKLSDLRNVEFNFDVDEKALKQKYRILMEETNYSIDSSVLKVSIEGENSMRLPTEGERGIFDYGVLPTKDVRRSHGKGYSSCNEKITINALWERLS